MITDVLYIPGMSVNLLSILLDRRGFTVFLEGQKIIITDQRTDTTVAHGGAVNGLYELTNSTSDRAFVSGDEVRLIEAHTNEVSRIVEVDDIAESRDIALDQHQRLFSDQGPPESFELMHQQLGHPRSHRMKDLHRYVEGVLEFGTTQPYGLYIVRFFSSCKPSVTHIWNIHPLQWFHANLKRYLMALRIGNGPLLCLSTASILSVRCPEKARCRPL